ncbi:LysR family transcriptional regulator [Alginatibacterium sediminis]|uniref:LysR family transcriptional regulator n=1 Tax=Alginatibacterium sediminis TaxID=2164068 RepID=A0A420EGI2_9ALTE|nr:LysR family transcriptional regulator [Alginatibacterium sediminis]RKF19770.1 LysR family transcriptional regulator [Alginatibacterium sediminis]
MYSIVQLQAFVATCQHGSFKQAAISLNKRASTVAELVSTLEDESDIKLFERHTRKLILTEAGRTLEQVASATLREAAHFSSMVNSINQQQPTKFSVAIDSMLTHPQISRCYRAVLEAFPNIELEVMTGDTLQVIEWISIKRVELGLISAALRQFDGMTQFTAFNFELVEVAAPTWFNHGAVVSHAQMRNLLQLNYSHLNQVDLDKRYQISHRVCPVNNTQEILNMVSEGIGWASVPRAMAQDWIDKGRIVEFSIEGGTGVNWFAEIAHLSETEPSIAADIFVQEIMTLNV